MDKLQAVFVSEATELIADLEGALLTFEHDLEDMNAVQEIFRVMHTLKGSASMFGYEHLSAFTHEMETVYDAVRDGRLTATDEILELTLRSVDHLKNLMADRELSNVQLRSAHEDLCKSIRHLMHGASTGVPAQESIQSDRLSTYYVACKPSPEIFNKGTNPLYLVDDLCSLGNALVLPRFELPAFHSMEPGTNYTSFEIVLSTAKSAADVRDVFMFVEDACEIVIERIAEGDLLLDHSFRNIFSTEDSFDRPAFGWSIVKNLAKPFLAAEGAKPAAHKALETTASSIRVSSDKLDELMNLVSELVTSQARLSLVAERHGMSELANVSENIEKITRRLRDNAFNICLVPVESLVVRFQRLVRDLSKELKKEVQFVAEGTDTELDRSIIEKVTDPILHILRNCLDHGIESPEERERSGKQRTGKIVLKAQHAGTSVIIQVTDDGRGIDVERVRLKAVSRGLIKAEDALTEKQILDLIFAPGFSTAEKVTDVSGRGVGMDIVKRNIESIHGEVAVSTVAGQGSTITIKLPLTLSIMDGMLVQIGSTKYILPLTSIDKCFELESSKITGDISQKHVFNNALLPVLNLHEYFSEGRGDGSMTQVIKINYDEFPVCITVDNIIGEYQAVMKPLGDRYANQEEFSGATILGDGSVALVIDTDKLVRQVTIQSLN